MAEWAHLTTFTRLCPFFQDAGLRDLCIGCIFFPWVENNEIYSIQIICSFIDDVRNGATSCRTFRLQKFSCKMYSWNLFAMTTIDFLYFRCRMSKSLKMFRWLCCVLLGKRIGIYIFPSYTLWSHGIKGIAAWKTLGIFLYTRAKW